jgi:signal peptidase II
MTGEASPAIQRNMNDSSRALRPSLFYAIVAIVFIADQMSKQWVQRMLIVNGPSRPIFSDAFLLTLTRNTGGAWGLLPQGNPVFVAFAVLAVCALLFAYHRMQRDLLVGGAFALALGGALGNLLDRLRFGYVVDFFDARIIHWPIFNVADSAITLGIVLLLLHFFRAARDERKEAAITPALNAPGTLKPEDAVSAPPE